MITKAGLACLLLLGFSSFANVTSLLDISVDCGTGNIAINNAIAQSFYPSVSGNVQNLAVWIKPNLYRDTSYTLKVFQGEPGSSLLLSESNVLSMGSRDAGTPAMFYEFTFSDTISLTKDTQYSWKLERTSSYSGAFARCPDSIQGNGYWLGTSPEPNYDYSFKLSISVLDISVDCGPGNIAINNAIAQDFYPSISGVIDKISIWIKPNLYHVTSYKLQLFQGAQPGTNLLVESSPLSMDSQTAGTPAQFYSFTFPSSGIVNKGVAYTWKLVRTSQYNGKFASCPDTVQGHGFWLGRYPELYNDYSFKLYF